MPEISSLGTIPGNLRFGALEIMDICGKKVIITGGARGMGRQFAVDLQALGGYPHVVDINQENLDQLFEEKGIPGTLVDVSREAEVVAFFEQYTINNGAPDIFINNAGITSDSPLLRLKGEQVRKFSLSAWEKVMQVNLTGVFLCGREAAAQMIRHGVKGLLINISSISRAGQAGQTNYSAAKAGVVAMTVAWSKELACQGIRVAAIAPGYIRTEMVAKMNGKILDDIVGRIPSGRLGEMQEISRAVQFVIECDYMNGRVLEVDGGLRI